MPHHATAEKALIIPARVSFSTCVCVCVCARACVAVYLNLHNLWVLSLPAMKIKCLSSLFHTNALKVTEWLMKGRKALAASQLAWWGRKSTALRSVMND